MGKDRPEKICCQDFNHAFDSGTDAEMYGSVFWHIDGDILVSSHGSNLRFCPWCAAEYKKEAT